MSRKAVIFDMGGVLVDLDIEGCKAAFKSVLDFQGIDDMIDPCHQKGIWGDLEEGILPADEFRRIVLAGSRPDATIREVDEAMSRILVGIAPYKSKMLRHMAKSYDLYMLSNNNEICLPFSARMFEEAGVPLEDIFLKLFLSFEMKALKPSPEFYRRVMEQIGRPSEELLFIDDSMKNVEGAIDAGLPAVYYEPHTDLAALLAEVLDDPSIADCGQETMEEC